MIAGDVEHIVAVERVEPEGVDARRQNVDEFGRVSGLMGDTVEIVPAAVTEMTTSESRPDRTR